MHINIKPLKEFLDKKFKHCGSIEPIGDGWWSQALSFYSNDEKLVIRISKHLTDFEKDDFAYKHFKSFEVPIPKIIEIGQFNTQFFYCISEYYEGIPSDQIVTNGHSNLPIAKKILQPLYHIHQLDTDKLLGWGTTDANGHGLFKSWQEYLLAVYNSKYPISWEELSINTWLDAKLFKELLKKMENLFAYLPSKKQVLHGDYGFDNLLLTIDNEISAVIDWSETTLGDSLYDLVHMNEPWNPVSGGTELFQFMENRNGNKRLANSLYE